MKSGARNRVLMLVENAPYRRDMRVSQESAALSAAGYQVAVICPALAGGPWHESAGAIQVYQYPAAPAVSSAAGYLWEYAYSLVAMFLMSLLVWVKDGFDVIHAANPPDTTFLLAAFYKIFGKTFVYDQHDLAPEIYQVRFDSQCNTLLYRMLTWCEALSYRLADHVIVTNLSYRAMAIQRGRVHPGRITVVRNGPDLNRLRRFEPESHLEQDGRKNVVYVGVIGFQDGVEHLLRALHHLTYDLNRNDFVCRIVGDGDALPAMRSLANSLSLDGQVAFVGWVDQLRVGTYLREADICVAPEPSNALNDRSTMVKLMEYMALGKPTVAFDLPEHRFTAREAAAYARPGSDFDFACQLAWLMDNPDQRTKMGRAGKTRIETELAWHFQAQELVRTYDDMIVCRASQVKRTAE